MLARVWPLRIPLDIANRPARTALVGFRTCMKPAPPGSLAIGLPRPGLLMKALIVLALGPILAQGLPMSCRNGLTLLPSVLSKPFGVLTLTLWATPTVWWFGAAMPIALMLHGRAMAQILVAGIETCR